MTEGAYTTSEISESLRQLRQAFGPKADATLIFLASQFGGSILPTVSVSVSSKNVIRADGATIEEAFEKARAAAAAYPKPSDAWAIIGAEAA